MWRFVLTVSLLCWRSEGTVTCRDNNNGAVDWYIIYKAPALQQLTGLEYLYIDSTDNNVKIMQPSTPNYKGINHPEGVLGHTLKPLFTSIRSMSPNFGFISYSDQPPGCSASDKFGHSKGVLMADKTGTGVWLLHSTPQFPFRRHKDHFWPESGARNAQIFICVTFPYNQFRHIGNHLQYIGAFPFEHDLPEDFHGELRDAVNWKQSPPPNNFQLLTSSASNIFNSIAKQQSLQAKVGDLYVTIAQLVGSDLDVQTWGCQSGRSRSYCIPRIAKVINIKTIRTGLGDWTSKNDHSKWCVAQNQNKDWICIADMNRAPTQYERRGGALCFQNAAVKKIFKIFTGATEDCTTPSIMDTMDTDCEPDSMYSSLMG
uniref:deoxyribonuclease-2-alpha-like isoform X2 n=1 Tax=Scatophagus argus TaxID=75038 RepID=UPI001ED83423|nr:deoxyribonuclease-2-alpha-like isoform X2 [Scatophagus argus]